MFYIISCLLKRNHQRKLTFLPRLSNKNSRASERTFAIVIWIRNLEQSMMSSVFTLYHLLELSKVFKFSTLADSPRLAAVSTQGS